MNKIEGLIAVPFTPMNKNGEVVFEQFPAYYNFLNNNRIAGAFINGSTGEGVSLSQQEKAKITKTWAAQKSADSKLKIINLVGGTSYAERIEAAQLSAEVGLDAIAILAPYHFFKPEEAGQLAEFCAKIAETVPPNHCICLSPNYNLTVCA